MNLGNSRLDALLACGIDLSEQEIATIDSDVSDIILAIGWFQTAGLVDETKPALVSNFIGSLRSAKFRQPEDLDLSEGDTNTRVVQLFAEFVFVQLWAKRDALTQGEANLLYSLLVPALSKSRLLNQAFSDEKREGMIIGFIADKILIPVAEGRDNSNAWDKVTRSWHLLGWMNNYLRDDLRKYGNATLSIDEHEGIHESLEQDSATRNQKDILTETEVAVSWEKGDGWSPDLLAGSKFLGGRAEIEEITSTLTMYNLTPEAVCQACASFITDNDDWIQHLLANVAAPNSLALDRFGNAFKLRSVQYKAAKLGIISGKSYGAGSDNINDYHKNTELGRWMAHTFDAPTPLRPIFIHTIFKLLCSIALKFHDP